MYRNRLLALASSLLFTPSAQTMPPATPALRGGTSHTRSRTSAGLRTWTTLALSLLVRKTSEMGSTEVTCRKDSLFVCLSSDPLREERSRICIRDRRNRTNMVVMLRSLGTSFRIFRIWGKFWGTKSVHPVNLCKSKKLAVSAGGNTVNTRTLCTACRCPFSEFHSHHPLKQPTNRTREDTRIETTTRTHQIGSHLVSNKAGTTWKWNANGISTIRHANGSNVWPCPGPPLMRNKGCSLGQPSQSSSLSQGSQTHGPMSNQLSTSTVPSKKTPLPQA